LDKYPEIFDGAFWEYADAFWKLPKKHLIKLLSDSRITTFNKNILIFNSINNDITSQDAMEYIKLYRDSIDKDFIYSYLERILVADNAVNNLSFMLQNYGQVLRYLLLMTWKD
jgi:hypothetical protein